MLNLEENQYQHMKKTQPSPKAFIGTVISGLSRASCDVIEKRTRRPFPEFARTTG